MKATLNKSWGLRFGAKLDQYLFILILVSLVLGFVFSWLLYRFNGAIPYLFAYVTFIMALGCSWTQIKQALQMRYAMLLVLIASHVVAPLIAYGMGILIFGAESPYLIGLVLFAIIPLGVSSVLWVGLSNGNVTFALAVIILDSALSPFVVPGEISLFFGAHIQFDHLKMMLDLVIIIVIPTLVGIGINVMSRAKAKPWSEPISAPTSKLAFLGVILLNAATIRPIAMQVKQDMLYIFPAVLVLVGVCYGLGMLIARLQSNNSLPITMVYTTGMRNNSLGIVLALSFFEARAAVPVLLSILIQQPFASLVQWIIKKK
ncbi:bile acid:sodium symporter family protein [Paenibacillus psychroresistens]|uniref:Bile acid:sodium symporter family protein n=1 Tax=Paenibacillus psychroresistens TaxID=1778678 RepID=A0A6B8RPL9_9BACL|nr:bile acid:sodium symporter family protein [Paenibacillus psychroresistens]QGQ97787.1 bile acid:sodium symporter family protein [Paenibacillus psychroresistens]